MKPKWWNKSRNYLIKKDRIIANLIKSYKGHLTTRNNFFYSLTRSIVSQQISVSAADSIFSRFEKKCKKVNPKNVSKLSITDLKKCGLSKMKAVGIKSLAKKILNKEFDPNLIKKMSDEEAINYLSSLRQIGRWSSEMVLIFFYNRPNIWPVQDIGLLRAISNNYNKKYLPPERFVNKLRKKFSPYCTQAVMALWYSVDNEPVQY